MKRKGISYNHRDPHQVEEMARLIVKDVCTNSDVVPEARKALELALTLQQILDMNDTSLYSVGRKFLRIKNHPWRKLA